MRDNDEQYDWSEGRESESGAFEGIVLGCVAGGLIWLAIYVVWRMWA